jgi:oligosaccharide repeat unit polymerase
MPGFADYVLIAIAFALFVAFPLLHRWQKHPRDFSEPIYLLIATFLLQYCFRAIEGLLGFDLFLGPPPWDAETLHSWRLVWVYLVAAYWLFFIGYHSRLGVNTARALPPLPEWDVRRWKLPVAVLLLISSVAYLWLIELSGGLHEFLLEKSSALVTGGTGYASFLSGLDVLACLIAYVSLGRKSWVFRLLAAFVLLKGLSSGARSAILAPVLTFLIAWHYLDRERWPLTPKKALVVILAILTVFPILLTWRASVEELVEDPFRNYKDTAVLYFSTIGSHYQSFAPFVTTVRDTPQLMEWQLGRTYLTTLVQWIPRQLWPDKPDSFAIEFTDTFFGRFFVKNRTVISPTLIGEAYINFHVLGLALVSFFGGVLWRTVYSYLIVRHRASRAGVFVYAMVQPFTLLFWESNVGAIYLPLGTVFCAVLTALAMRVRPVRSRPIVASRARTELSHQLNR